MPSPEHNELAAKLGAAIVRKLVEELPLHADAIKIGVEKTSFTATIQFKDTGDALEAEVKYRQSLPVLADTLKLTMMSGSLAVHQGELFEEPEPDPDPEPEPEPARRPRRKAKAKARRKKAARAAPEPDNEPWTDDDGDTHVNRPDPPEARGDFPDEMRGGRRAEGGEGEETQHEQRREDRRRRQ